MCFKVDYFLQDGEEAVAEKKSKTDDADSEHVKVIGEGVKSASNTSQSTQRSNSQESFTPPLEDLTGQCLFLTARHRIYRRM